MELLIEEFLIHLNSFLLYLIEHRIEVLIRQISLILAKIPSRDAFPSDIFNIHASILERIGKLKLCY